MDANLIIGTKRSQDASDDTGDMQDCKQKIDEIYKMIEEIHQKIVGNETGAEEYDMG